MRERPAVDEDEETPMRTMATFDPDRPGTHVERAER